MVRQKNNRLLISVKIAPQGHYLDRTTILNMFIFVGAVFSRELKQY